MNDPRTHRIEEFLRSFAQALGHPAGSRDAIIAEIRADLAAHIERYQSAGKSPAEAVDLALAELGDPQELAREIRPAAAPLDGPVLTAIRYVAGAGLALWMLLLAWTLRAGSYGLAGSGITVGVMLLHLPLVLLVWPRIIWRRNWLFGLIPAGVAFAVALFFAMAGQKSEMTLDSKLFRPGGDGNQIKLPVEAAPKKVSGNPSLPSKVIPVFAVAGGVVLFLILAMQRSGQRRTAALAMLVAFTLVEVSFQIEESLFRTKVKSARDDAISKARDAKGGPTPQPDAASQRRNLVTEQAGFTFAWPRPLSPGRSIVYHAEEDRIEIRD